MTKALKINKNTVQSLQELLEFFFENKKIKGVFTLKKLNKDNDVGCCLITKKDELKDIVPFYPLMPANAGKLLSRFTLKGGVDQPVVVIIKPCELRAFVELVKREQGNLENLVFISSTCGGVYPLEKSVKKDIDKNISKYWDAVQKLEMLNDLRPACRSCEEFVPYNADFTVDLVGNKNMDKQSIILINSKKGEELIHGFKAGIIEKDLDKNIIDKYREKREKEKNKLFDEIGKKTKGIEGLIEIFGRCIGCHGCSKVCPICYCKLCEFESPDAEYDTSNYEREMNKKGGTRVPTGTIYYQLGRLDHIGISCVACGQCEDVCPVDIPLSIIFKKVGESVQKLFSYTPGKNVDEALPFTTFETNELKEVEE